MILSTCKLLWDQEYLVYIRNILRNSHQNWAFLWGKHLSWGRNIESQICVSNKHFLMLSVTYENHKLSHLNQNLKYHIYYQYQNKQEHFNEGSMIYVLKNYNGFDLCKLSVSQKPKLKQTNNKSKKDYNAQLSCSKTLVCVSCSKLL